MNVLVMGHHIFIYMYVYMKCVLTNDFMRSASLDLVHHRVVLRGATRLVGTGQPFKLNWLVGRSGYKF